MTKFRNEEETNFVVFVVSTRIFLIFHHFNDLNLVVGITKGSV